MTAEDPRQNLPQSGGGRQAHPARGAPLSPRERQVLALVVEGLPNRALGTRLGIGERTVESHVHGILTKLGLTNRAQIVRWALAPPVAPARRPRRPRRVPGETAMRTD